MSLYFWFLPGKENGKHYIKFVLFVHMKHKYQQQQAKRNNNIYIFLFAKF